MLDELAAYAPVRVVLGNNDRPDVAAWGAPETLEIELDGLTVAMIHDSGPAAGRVARMRRRFPSADLVVFGHSHIPMDLTENGLRIFNPGSPTDKRRQPYGTVGELEIADGHADRGPDHRAAGDADDLELRPARYDSPDAIALTEQVQQFYVEIYGGPDGTPFTAEEFAPPHGGFLVGYLDGRPVAMGGWRFAPYAAPAGADRRRPRSSGCSSPTRPAVAGSARRLLTALEDDARAAGADWMVLETGQPQVAAVGLYRGRRLRRHRAVRLLRRRTRGGQPRQAFTT